MSDAQPLLRQYARQIAVPAVGLAGQQRLAAARVLVIGAGGLASTVLPALCGAGVGRLVVVDPDHIEASNLHRQTLYRVADVGRSKAGAAARALRELNPQCVVEPLALALTPANAAQLVAGADLVVDAADSFAVTYVLSDACQRARRPLVSASVLGMSGYVGAFCGDVPAYRALFPDLPARLDSCATAGVLGPVVAVIGALQAQLATLLLLDPSAGVSGRLFTADLATLRISSFSFRDAMEAAPGPRFIAADEVTADDVTVELRDAREAPRPAFPSSLRVEMSGVDELPAQVAPQARLVLCCRTGLRAWRAARRLESLGRRNVVLLAVGH